MVVGLDLANGCYYLGSDGLRAVRLIRIRERSSMLGGKLNVALFVVVNINLDGTIDFSSCLVNNPAGTPSTSPAGHVRYGLEENKKPLTRNCWGYIGYRLPQVCTLCFQSFLVSSPPLSDLQPSFQSPLLPPEEA